METHGRNNLHEKCVIEFSSRAVEIQFFYNRHLGACFFDFYKNIAYTCTMFSTLHIELGDDNFDLKFQLLDSPITELWVERMQSRQSYTLDDPARFYGFNNQTEEIAIATAMITRCIDTINAYQPIINRQFTTVHDQDCLNYLHNIFERYHGLLDQQTTEYWNNAPDSVRRALANLNIAVHRCETASQGSLPRFVCTWFGMPKIKTLPLDLMSQHGVLTPTWGSVCLNYVEIGKTLEDLAHDNDQYIADIAFKPFNFYSADFNVRFYEPTPPLDSMKNYYNIHREFFGQRGLTDFNDPRLLPLRFPVAELAKPYDKEQLLDQIRQRQYVNKVYLQ